MCPGPDNNNPLVNQNTNPITPLSPEEFASKSKQGALIGQQLEVLTPKFTDSGESFSDITSSTTSAFDNAYEERMKELEKEVVKEEYDDFLSGAGKFIANTATTAGAFTLDLLGFITDPADWRLPTVGGSIDAVTGLFGYKTNAADYTGWVDPLAYVNKGFEALDDYTLLGDGDVTGNGWTRAAQTARDYANHYFQVNTTNDWWDWGVNSTSMILGNAAGMFVPGAAIAKGAQLANLSQRANTLLNAFVMTESTGMQIAQDVHDKVYGEVLNTLSNGQLKNVEDAAYQQAYQDAINNGNNTKDAEWAGMQASKEARNEFALANPELGAQASKNAGYGADIALKGMAPIFAFNLITANAFTKSLYNPRNILSKPSRVGMMKAGEEAGSEFIEEGFLEKQAEQIGVSYGTKGEYTAKDLSSIVWDYDKNTLNYANLYEGAMGALAGGLMSAGRDVLSYGKRKKDYDTQQETIEKQNEIGAVSNIKDTAGIRQIVDNATTITKNIQQVSQLAKQASLLDAMGKKEQANIIKSKMLDVQAYQAFSTGTTANLIENYEKIASNTNAGPEVQMRAREAVAQIKQMEEIYKQTRGKFINDQEIYSSKILNLSVDKAEKQLETEIIQKKLEADAAIKLELESGRTSLSKDVSVIDNETGKVVETKKEQLGYDVSNLKVNPYTNTDTKDAETYRNFSEHIGNNVQAVRELNELQERLGEVKKLKEQNFEHYNEITSKPYQNSLRFERKFFNSISKSQKELEEVKGTDKYMPLVESVLEKYKGKITDKRYNQIKEYFEEENNTKKVAEQAAKEEIKKNEFAKTPTDTEVKPTGEEVVSEKVKPEGTKAMLESVANKLATGQSVKNLSQEEQQFYMNNSEIVDKRRGELQSGKDTNTQSEITEDEEISTEIENLSGQVSTELDEILEATTPGEKESEVKPLSKSEVKDALGTSVSQESNVKIKPVTEKSQRQINAEQEIVKYENIIKEEESKQPLTSEQLELIEEHNERKENLERHKEFLKEKKYNYSWSVDEINYYYFDEDGDLMVGVKDGAKIGYTDEINSNKVKRIEKKQGKEAAINFIKETLRKGEPRERKRLIDKINNLESIINKDEKLIQELENKQSDTTKIDEAKTKIEENKRIIEEEKNKSKITPVVEQKQPTLSQKEQEILNSFKDNKASKPLINRKFAANKSEIESLLAKGIIKEDGNNYVIAGREAQEVTLTVEKTKAEQVADNLLAKEFTLNPKGTYDLQINLKALTPEERADVEDAVKVINERIKNNQLDGWKIEKQSNPLFEAVTITKPNLTSNQPMEEGDVSYQPDEIPSLTKEQEEKIKDLIESYATTMEIDNNKFPTFEELVKSYIRTVGKEKAEKHLKLLGTGWELNGYGTINDYNAILRKLFGKYEDIALGLSAMSEELSQSVATPVEVKEKQKELIEKEEIKDSRIPIDVTPDKQVVYSTETDIVSDTSPKLGFSLFDFTISQTVRDKDGKTIVTTNTINEGLKKKLDEDKLVKAIKTANFENVKVGTKLTVGVNPLNELNRVKSWVIPVRVEDKNDPLYGNDVVEKGKVKTITFGEWLDQKLEESGLLVEEFIETQEFWDRVPILVSDEQGDFIGQIRDIGWYTPTKFGGDINEARRNVNEIRKAIKEAFKRGENSVFEITSITGGKYTPLILTETIPLKQANPQAMVGLIVRHKDGSLKTFIYENGKRKEVKVENLSVITGAEENKSKSMMIVDIRRWGTDEEGNPTYKAFYSTSPKLSASQVETVKNIIYSKFIVANTQLSTSQNNKFAKTLDAINSTVGIDLSNNDAFVDLLKRFVFISPISKNISAEYYQSLVNKVNEGKIEEVENELVKKYFTNIKPLKTGETAILSLSPNTIIVAKATANGTQVKIINNNTIPVENNEIQKTEDFLQRDALLKEVLQNSFLNGYAQANYYLQPVIQVNNDFTVTTIANSYPEFVQNNILTNLMSINVGTNDNPVYATRLQSNIYYKPVGTTEGKSISRKEGQVIVSDSKVTEKDKQTITNVVESASDEAFEDAVEGVEQDGFELFGETKEEKAEDLKSVVKKMNNESKEIVENHLEAKPNLEDITEYNEFLTQASNKVKWVNEYFNEDDTETAESLESNQPREIGEEDIKDMNINLLRINGISSRHQTQIAIHAAVKLGDILSDEKINQKEVRDKVVEEINKVLGANKEALQETLAELKSIPQYQDRPKVMSLVVKYETALNKINLLLENVDVVYQESLSMVLKDLNGKVTENKQIEIGNDPKENDLDNEENEEDIDDELSEEEDRYLGTENYSKTSLEVNPKASITSTLRRFMRGIPDINSSTGLPKTGAMGVTTYVDFDTVYDVVQSLLADAPVDFNMMMDILEVNKGTQPWLPILITKLKESSSEVKNQFTTTMGKHALTMEFLMYYFDEDKNVTFKIVNTNLSSINRKIKDEWRNNLKTSNVLIDEYGNVSRETVDELLRTYNSWMETPSSLRSEYQRFIKERLKLDETSFKADENDRTKGIAEELKKQESKSKITNVDGKEYLVSLGSDNTITISPYGRNIVSKAIVNYNNLTPQELKQATEEIQDWFDAFGIQLTDNAIDGLFKDKKTTAEQFFEKNNTFAVGTLVQWLNTTQKALSQDKEVTITDESKNNPLENSSINDLAYHQSKYSSGIVTSSFRDGKKSIYGFTAFKFITDRANEIKNKPEFRENLRKLSFSKKSFWLQLFEDGVELPVFNFKNRFNVTHLGLTALKELSKKLYRDNGITALGDVDHELVKVGMHQADQGALSKPFTIFGQQVSLRNITTLFPTMSDKSTMTLIKTLGLNLADKKYFNKTESGKLVPNKSIAEFIFEQTVLPEIERVINFNAKNPNGTDIKNYDKGAKMLLLMPHLNDLVIFEQDGKKVTLNEAINTTDADLQKVLLKKDVIITEVQNYVSALVEKKMQVWAANGYYTVKEETFYKDDTDEIEGITSTKTKVTNKLLDKKYMEGVVADSQLEKIEIAAMDFEINQMLSNANAFMTMIGDPAVYYKADSSKSYIQQSKETFVNVGKRLALMIAPGSKLADSETEQYTQVMIDDRLAMSENVSFLTEVLDNKKFDWKEYNRIKSLNTKSEDPVEAKKLKDEQKKQFKEFYAKYPNSNGYFDIEGTDAQEYTTWQEHLHILEKLGRLSDATATITPEEIREAKEMFANNVPLEKMSDKQKGILKKVLQPIKPVYTGQIFDEAQDVMRTVYIKSSSFPLIPQVTKGTELEKLRSALEDLQKEGAGPNPSPYKYVRASYQTANKVGAKSKVIQIYEDDGSIKKLKPEELKASSLILNRKDFKIQLDVPFKSFKKKEDTVSLGTQLNKILFGNGIMDATGFMYNGVEVTGKELEKEYTKAFIELSNLKRQQLYDELGIDIKTNKPTDVRATAAKLQNILKTEAVNRGYSKQDVEALEVIIKEIGGEEDLTFKLPLWLAANANRFESLLNAIVNNRIVKLKFPGSSFVAGSEEGFKFQHDFKDVDENKIVWTNKWNGQGLQAAKYDADGNLQYAQVIAPSKFRKKDGTLIDLLSKNEYGQYIYVIESKTGNKTSFKLKENMIDPELRNITAFRIPTSGHMSAAQVEIVGFLPNEQGDLMIVPRNLTKQKGLDFDVDKENTYQLWHETSETGKITVLKEGDREKLLQNEIIKIHTAVLSNPSKEVQKKINNILSIDYAKEQAENIDEMISSTKDDTFFTPLSSEYQKEKMFLGASGKIGIGAYSLDVTTHSLFEQAKAKGNQVSLNYSEINDAGKTITNPFHMSFEGEGHTDGTLGNQETIDGERTIAQVLSELQNIATDNEKEQVMGRVNLNSYTLDVSKILAMLGFDKAKNGNSIQFTFLSQPIIREYVKEMDNANSNVAEFNPNKESAVIIKLLEKYGNKNYELGYDVDVRNTKNFTMDKMENQLKGNVDNDFQLAVLNRFLELKKLGVAVRTLQTAINTDSKGLGKSILDNSQKIESINNLLINPLITNASTLLGNFVPIVKMNKEGNKVRVLSEEEYQSYINEGYVKFGDNLFLPTTVSGVFTANALVTATSLWDRHFPYNSQLFKTIFDSLMPLISKSEASDARKVEKKTMVIKEIKRYLNSYTAASTLFDNINAQAERERLFFDRTSTGKASLATYIKDLKRTNSSLASNKLIERLELVVSTQGEPSLIKFNNSSSGFYDENGLNNALLELMELNINLPSFNGEPYTSRKLAQDLITYSYLEGGVQEATQFVKFIPLSYLDKMGFSLNLSNIDFNSKGATSIFDIIANAPNNNSKFITQFAQHNPAVLPKLDNYIPGIDKRKDLDKLLNFNVQDLSKEADGLTMPDFVSMRYEGKYLLWKKTGQGNYTQIPVVQSGISEYDNKVQQITPLASEIIVPQNPIKEQPLSPTSDESRVTNETRFGLNTDASLTDIVTNLANSIGIDEYLVTLAKQLLPAIDSSTTITVGDIKTKGKYQMPENAIIISRAQAKNATDTELARTILKELMHSITNKELAKHVYRSSADNKYYLQSSNAPKYISELIRLFNQVSKIPEFEKAMEAIKKKLAIEGQEQVLTQQENRIYYGAYDVYEFVEMMMTQPEFQKEMAKIKTDSGKSVLDLFKNFINTLFKNLGVKFETGTVASEAIENILILVDEKGRLKQQAPEVKSTKLPSEKNMEIETIQYILNSIIEFIPNHNGSIAGSSSIIDFVINKLKNNPIYKNFNEIELEELSENILLNIADITNQLNLKNGIKIEETIDGIYYTKINSKNDIKNDKDKISNITNFIKNYKQPIQTPEVKPVSKNKISDNIKSFVNSLIPNWIDNKNNELSLASEFKSIQLLSEGESTIEDRINFGKEAEKLIREGVRGKNPFEGVTFESQIPNLLYAVISGKLAESNISEKDMYDNIFSTQPEVKSTTTTQPSTVITDAKADIQRRRQEAIDSIQTMEELGLEAPIGKEGFFYADAFGVDPEESDLDSFEGKTKQEVIDKINAKYNAELAALESSKPSTTSEKPFTTKVDQFTYTYNPVTKQVIHNAKSGDKVETNETQINKVLAAYAKANNFETKVFNKQEYVQINGKVLNVNTGSKVIQKEIVDLFNVSTQQEFINLTKDQFNVIASVENIKTGELLIPIMVPTDNDITRIDVLYKNGKLINEDTNKELTDKEKQLFSSAYKFAFKFFTEMNKALNKVKYSVDKYENEFSQIFKTARENPDFLELDKPFIDFLNEVKGIYDFRKEVSKGIMSYTTWLINPNYYHSDVKMYAIDIFKTSPIYKLFEYYNAFTTQPNVVLVTEPTVSNPVKNDLLNILEEIQKDIDEDSDNLDFPVVNAGEFSGYPNIQKYLNSEFGIEQREYQYFKANKDVVENLLSGMKEVNPNNLLEKLKSITDTNDTGVNSDINPIISADTKKDQELLKKANEQIKNTKYELFPGVNANVKQTEAIDKLTDFLKTPRDKSEKTQSTFVLVGRGGTGKTTIVKKIVDEFPGKTVVGGAISHTAKNNLKKSLKVKNVRTIASLTGIGVFDDLNDFKDTTLERADIIIIDECSMIDAFTMNRIYQLANPNAKIIFMGDNVQLPPINEKSSPTFDAATKPEYNAKLTERMRQGEDSPIVPLSDIVAENIEREEKQIERKVIKRRDSNFNPITNKGVIFTENNNELMSNLERDFKADVQNTKIITFTNDEGKSGSSDNKKEMNRVVRNILWGADAKNEYNIGEILVADNIIYDANILNGEYYEVQSVKPINDAVKITDIELVTGKGVVQKVKTFPGYSLKVKVISETDNFNKIITLNLPSADSKEKINEIQDRLEKAKKSLFIQNKKIIPDVNYGYAITSHKSQGSTFNNAYVMEDNIINSRMDNKQANQALYVAMTRPRNKLVMFSQLKEGEFLTEKEKANMVKDRSLQPEEIEDWTSQTNECGI
jgi:hypothetical protein